MTLSETVQKQLEIFAKSCRYSIVKMVSDAKSGHAGGSLSTLDFLATLYTQRLVKTSERIVISNGHISPAVYSVLGECGIVDKAEAIKTFRKPHSKFEGHVSRHLDGIHFGTGPLGVGISVAAGLALAEKLHNSNKKVFCTIGDGEMQEGQVHEAALFANAKNLNNLCVFVDYNRVQLTDSLAEICPINVASFFREKNWNVVEIDGHNFKELFEAISKIDKTDKPLAIIGKTIMGHGVKGMEEDGKNLNPKWHGSPPSPEQAVEMLKSVELTAEENEILANFQKTLKFDTEKNKHYELNKKTTTISTGEEIVYESGEKESCRNAYGHALENLAKNNPQILALTADVGTSVMTKFTKTSLPKQFVECGICEQNMISVAGGLSVAGFIPFASTFGAFLSSRGRDQARVNDINMANCKMVATHCGLSVGQDGPTHQAIDDAGSFVGFKNTGIIEPADANHCDRIVRYIATHEGNFYVRMGRSALPVLSKENGELLYPKNYKYKYGSTETLRFGNKLTIVAIGGTVAEAVKFRENFANPQNIEIIVASSMKEFDDNLIKSVEKTRNVLSTEDHSAEGGMASQLTLFFAKNNLSINKFRYLAVNNYQLSGSASELYKIAKIDSNAIAEIVRGEFL